MRRALIVVGKAPIAGGTKTRLVPPLAPQDAADLYAGFLLDTLELAASVGWERTSLIHPRGDGPRLETLVGSARSELLEQPAEGLGNALAYAFEHHLAAGYDAAVLIGSDNPTLSREPIIEALAALWHGADLTLGGTVDGGYYLIGMRQPHLGVFTGIEWSTSHVYAQTLSRARDLGLRVEPVTSWYDVDEPPDLERLAREVAAGPPTLARHTRLVLERLSSTNELVRAASAWRPIAQRTRA
jgi:rSAM/selenodomain-associated transferase 1